MTQFSRMRVLASATALSAASASISFSQYVNINHEMGDFHSIKGFESSTTTDYFLQRIDHFDGMSSDLTFPQRFHMTDFSEGDANAPLFVYIGGEAPLTGREHLSGMFPVMAASYKAIAYSLEHRFYGDSFLTPSKNMDSTALRFHNTQQALADLAHFIASKKNHPEQKVIVFGCSYPGSLAAYMRTHYPHIVTGAIASSAPVLAKTDFVEYDRQVVDAILAEGDDDCLVNILNATEEMEAAVVDGELVEAKKFLDDVNCPNFRLNDRKDRVAGMYVLADMIAFAVQYNKNGTIKKMCNTMNDESRTFKERLGRFLKDSFAMVSSPCADLQMTLYTEDFVQERLQKFQDEGMLAARSWLYQSCTNYGYWQTAPEKGHTSRSRKIDVEFHMSLCDILYPLISGKKWIDQEKHTNNLFGGRDVALSRLLAATNIHFANGERDPWKHLSVTYEDLKKAKLDERTLFEQRGISVFELEGGSHCLDFHAPSTSAIAAAHAEIRKKIDKYLSSDQDFDNVLRV